MNARRLLQPPRLSFRASAGLVPLRLVAGIAMMMHGWGKIQSPFDWMGPEATIPGIFQALAAVSEFGGGLAWILGLLTPLASLGMLSTMAVATYFHAVIFKDPFVAKAAGGGSYELALVYLCVAVLLIFAGPGRFSLDRQIFGERDAA